MGLVEMASNDTEHHEAIERSKQQMMLTQPLTQFARTGEYRFDFQRSITRRSEKLRSAIKLERQFGARALNGVGQASQCSQSARKMTGSFDVRGALRSLFSRCFPMQNCGLHEVRGRVVLSYDFGRC